jgi:hypothetical protein
MRLLEINEEILRTIDRSWNDPRPIPASWFRSMAAYAFHERLSALIASEYGDCSADPHQGTADLPTRAAIP